jgi:subtilisin family serine protease
MFSAGTTSPHPGQAGSRLDHQPGEILLKLRKDSPTALALHQADLKKKDGVKSVLPSDGLGQVLAKHGVSEMKQTFRVAGQAGATPTSVKAAKKDARAGAKTRDDLFRRYRLTVSTNADVTQVVAALKAHTDVEAAEPNDIRRLAEVVPSPPPGLPDGTTDADYSLQWHLDFTRIPEAWDYLRQKGQNPGGSRDVIVAVIDTEVDFNHEELVGNMWTNSGEIPGNGVDDDGNGFIDDIHGCSVISDPRSHSGESSDLNGHGTPMAGIIAATAFNLKGGVGATFNTQIMSVRAAQYSGVLSVADVPEALLYAVDHGAEVINMSFGRPGPYLLGSRRSPRPTTAVALPIAPLPDGARPSSQATQK